MVKLIGILVLSGNLSVAVETDTGFTERSFPNSADGAEELIAYAEQTVGTPEHGVQIVVGWLDDTVNDKHIMSIFDSFKIPHVVALPRDIHAASTKHKLAESSPVAVALSFKDTFPELWKRKSN